jgi:cyclopropane-fatty-acyl-phospholipid synthase
MLDSLRINVVFNGFQPSDPQVHDERLYDRVLKGGTLALGEAYADGVWSCKDIPELFSRILRSGALDTFRNQPLVALREKARSVYAKAVNRQSIARSKKVGEVHYDDRLFNSTVLGTRMSGTCAYFDTGAATLDEAQEAKLDLVCRKLGLKGMDRVLDIGCGWGSFGGFAQEKYGANVDGYTISNDQAVYARERYADMVGGPLKFNVEDYREISAYKEYDYAVSLGMLEHVGVRNYPRYFDIVKNALRKDGIFLLHCIVANKEEQLTDEFIDKYIFPGGHLGTEVQIISAARKAGFLVEDVHNLGVNYEHTLRAWNENFQKKRDVMVGEKGERGTRIYEYYLQISEGAFRSRKLNIMQFVLTPGGRLGGYKSVR